jgi:phosphoribosylamine--glycine ligase
MNILIIGSGGREHAFALKLKQSHKCANLYVAPGNAGTGETAENINIGVGDFEGIKNLVIRKRYFPGNCGAGSSSC